MFLVLDFDGSPAHKSSSSATVGIIIGCSLCGLALLGIAIYGLARWIARRRARKRGNVPKSVPLPADLTPLERGQYEVQIDCKSRLLGASPSPSVSVFPSEQDGEAQEVEFDPYAGFSTGMSAFHPETLTRDTARDAEKLHMPETPVDLHAYPITPVHLRPAPVQHGWKLTRHESSRSVQPDVPASLSPGGGRHFDSISYIGGVSGDGSGLALDYISDIPEECFYGPGSGSVTTDPRSSIVSRLWIVSFTDPRRSASSAKLVETSTGPRAVCGAAQEQGRDSPSALAYPFNMATQPLQSVVASMVRITELAKSFRSDTRIWTDVSSHVQTNVQMAMEKYLDDETPPVEMQRAMDRLSSTLQQIVKDMEKLHGRPTIVQLFKTSTSSTTVEEMKHRVSESIR
ncbi:hypothetical protein FB45DRAFT_1011210 [Roridomyces roridus]|uniref:Uncharacterized protein n=1 Tax=Roridomyces roridus TaxID=1738132 RepID=A0AAD7B2A3_9AGAR|nr:hypothetical protein FB45DRAFT_1011210 [Roridomyces roridus]